MTQNRITIRPAIRADAGAIAELANELNRFHNNPDNLYSAELIESEAFEGTPLFSVMVAECDGVLVGYAFFQVIFDSETTSHGVWLHDLFVRGSARRQGIGQGLLAAVAQETVARGGRLLSWSVFRDNQGARAFYAGLGARDIDADVIELELGGEALTDLAQAARE